MTDEQLSKQIPYTSYEQYISQTMNKQGDYDKTFTDKILGRQDTDDLIILIQKDELSRKDFSRILNIISGINSKLVNFNEYDRYLLGKFYTWIRSFIKLSMGCIAIQELIEIYITNINKILTENDEVKKNIDIVDKLNQNLIIYKNCKDVLLKCRNIMCDDSKFLLDVFLFLSNSTLSLSAAAFDTLTTSRFEYAYPGGHPQIPMMNLESPQKKNIFNFWRNKK